MSATDQVQSGPAARARHRVAHAAVVGGRTEGQTAADASYRLVTGNTGPELVPRTVPSVSRVMHGLSSHDRRQVDEALARLRSGLVAAEDEVEQFVDRLTAWRGRGW